MEKISYYMSSMVLLNVFYIIKNLSLLDITKSIFQYSLKDIFLFSCIIVSTVFLIWGIIYTIIILKTNFNPQPSEGGKEHIFVNKKNITSAEYFGKFSLLVMTGLSIGGVPLWWGLLIYIMFYALLGIIFIRCDMFYLNPAIILFGYEIYKCECLNGSNKEILYFVIKNIDLTNMDSINSTSTNKKIIRLKGKE